MQQGTITKGLTELDFMERMTSAMSSMRFQELHTREKRLRAALVEVGKHALLPEDVLLEGVADNPVVVGLMDLYILSTEHLDLVAVLKAEDVRRRAWTHYQEKFREIAVRSKV